MLEELETLLAQALPLADKLKGGSQELRTVYSSIEFALRKIAEHRTKAAQTNAGFKRQYIPTSANG